MAMADMPNRWSGMLSLFWLVIYALTLARVLLLWPAFCRALIGSFDVDLLREFFQGFTNHGLVTLHIDNLRGENAHHQAETVFKAFGRALRMALENDERTANRIPSTKGSL